MLTESDGDDCCGDLEDAIAVLRFCRELEAMADLLVPGGDPRGGDRKNDL